MSGFDSDEFMRLVDSAAQVIAEKDIAVEKARADQWMRLGRKYDDIRDSIRSCPDTPEGHAEFYEQSATIIFGSDEGGRRGGHRRRVDNHRTDTRRRRKADPVSGWREGFHRDVLTWLPKYLEEMRPHGDWGTPAEIVSLEEELDKSFSGSDVTAGDDPRIMLTITWKNTAGERHSIWMEMTLTELMRRLDA